MMQCRHCGHTLQHPFLDLGSAPPSNAYLTKEALSAPEMWFPLRVLVCDQCWLVQTEDHAGREALFSKDYAYFSSFSSSWLAHSERYVENMVSRFGLGKESCVVEVAANDGYLLQYVQSRAIPCYGIEPTASTAAAARAKGLQIEEEFFGVGLAERLVAQGRQADLTAANNVLAHVPDINDFVRGFARLLKPQGVATFEFPHLLRMVQECQFDTAYHEHYSYLSLHAVRTVFEANGLSVFDVEELTTHGGSLRVFAQRKDGGLHPVETAVERVLSQEVAAGLLSTQLYADFMRQPARIVRELLSFLIDAANKGKTVGAYGAAAKGNTLLNFAGVRPHLLPYVVDLNPAKQNKYMPGSQIPIVSEEHLRAHRPDYVVILPWNLRTEVMQQLSYIREWGGQFVIAVPELKVSP
jgi:SAM-dependent methyltransferase